jgi:hypothetical protein
MMTNINKKKRIYGEHLTPIDVFKKFILPEIKDKIYDYIWVDLFAGEGNLILPILELIPENERTNFFKEHIFMFDIQKELVERTIENAMKYGIPKDIATKNIIEKDTLKNYPEFLLNLRLPVYHITNPPYLYIGYIVKHKETQRYLDCFKASNEGYQDLYQLALINDLRHGIRKMIYIIPSNFLFGFSVSNKIRDDFLKYYSIEKSIILEKEIFESTGTNTVICFFERKEKPVHRTISFEGVKINKEVQKKTYVLNPKNHYRAGNYFDEFLNNYQSARPLKINFYLTIEDIEKNKGDYGIVVVDANAFNGKEYARRKIYVNKNFYEKIKSNTLFVRTVDTGSMSGRAGLYKITDVFGADGILVSKARYRTHPIQIFVEPSLTEEEQTLLMNYFNLILEYFRKKTDSEFMTTYKYSNSEYTRKYLGLSQAKKLIQTFPWLELNDDERAEFRNLIENKKEEEIITFIKRKFKRGLELWY